MMVMQYYILQDQMNQAMTFGFSMMFMVMMIGMVQGIIAGDEETWEREEGMLGVEMKLLPRVQPTVAGLAEKWLKARRNSALALKDLEGISLTYDVTDCKEALVEYQHMDRADYDDYGEYQEARDDAWEQFVERLEDLAAQEEENALGGKAYRSLVEKYGEWAVNSAIAVCPLHSMECIEREARRLYESRFFRSGGELASRREASGGTEGKW